MNRKEWIIKFSTAKVLSDFLDLNKDCPEDWRERFEEKWKDVLMESWKVVSAKGEDVGAFSLEMFRAVPVGILVKIFDEIEKSG